MSGLPGRDLVYQNTPTGRALQRAVLRMYARGELKSRDEMNEQAAWDALVGWWGADGEWVGGSETITDVLDAAWGVADE